MTPTTFSQGTSIGIRDFDPISKSTTASESDEEVSYENASSTGSEDEVVQNIEHDHQYPFISSWERIHDFPEKARNLFKKSYLLSRLTPE